MFPTNGAMNIHIQNSELDLYHRTHININLKQIIDKNVISKIIRKKDLMSLFGLVWQCFLGSDTKHTHTETRKSTLIGCYQKLKFWSWRDD